MRAFLLTLAMLVLTGCPKKATPVATDAAAPVAPVETIVVAPVEAAAPVADVDDAAAPPSSEITELYGKPQRVGNVAVGWDEDGEFCNIRIQEGKKPLRLVRRTSGAVHELVLVQMVDGDYAVAWASVLGPGGHVAAVSFVSKDLTKVSAPVTLALVHNNQYEAHVAMVANPKGGVVTAHAGKLEGSQVVFEATAVTPDGKTTKLGSKSIEGGTTPAVWLLPLDTRGVIAYGASYAGGRLQATMVLPWAPGETAPKLTPPICTGSGEPPEAFRGTQGELVALCSSPRYGDNIDKCMKPIEEPKDRCLRVSITDKDGKPITPPDETDTPVSKVECVGKSVKLGYVAKNSLPPGSGPPSEVTLNAPSKHVADWLKKKCE